MSNIGFRLFLWNNLCILTGCFNRFHRIPHTLHRYRRFHRSIWIMHSNPIPLAMANGQKQSTPDRKRVVILSGPTAIGKSKVAAQLCASCQGLIVSADSVQAYRGIQIGANKPTFQEWHETPHLLVDVVDNHHDDYNAAEWRQDALFCIRQLLREESDEELEKYDDDKPNNAAETDDKKKKLVHERRSNILQSLRKAREIKNLPPDQPILPVVVGGTMMYIQWLLYGRPDAMKPTMEACERALGEIQKLQTLSWEDAIRSIPQSLDPIFIRQAQKLSPNDWYRLRRILEVAYSVPFNAEIGKDHDEHSPELYTGKRYGGLIDQGYDVRCFFLCPSDRMTHCHVVDTRCEQMLQRGLLRETADLANEMSDMVEKAIGYRQSLSYLGREEFVENDVPTFDRFVEDFQAATRRYSKRQMQWFRKDQNFFFVPVSVNYDGTLSTEEATDEILRLMSLARESYDKERLMIKSEGVETCSQRTRRCNEQQGRAMKTFQTQRTLLLPGSSALREMLEDADHCTKIYRDTVHPNKRPKKAFMNSNAGLSIA